MKINVGDKLFIRNDLIVGLEYGGITFDKTSSNLLGELVVITNISKSSFGGVNVFEIEGSDKVFTKTMLAPIINEEVAR